jgi:hypothetical protein
MEQINTDSKAMVDQGDFVWYYYDEDILYEKLLEVRLNIRYIIIVLQP